MVGESNLCNVCGETQAFIVHICYLLVVKALPQSGRQSRKWVGFGVTSRFQSSLVAQLVKNPPATWETWVQSLGWEDPLKKGMASHSSILAWRIPWTV